MLGISKKEASLLFIMAITPGPLCHLLYLLLTVSKKHNSDAPAYNLKKY